MKILEVKNRSETLITQLLEIWEDSVTATHTFLSRSEINTIKKYVPSTLKRVSSLIVAEFDDNFPIAFMGIEETKVEMLFVKNIERGKGVGSLLLNYGINNYHVSEVTVNEQNPLTKTFYEHMEFKSYKGTELDEQGNAYPLIYMRLEK